MKRLKKILKWLGGGLLGLAMLGFALLQASEWLVPYYWGNVPLKTKMVYLKQHKKDFDTFFIGSSRVYRQINPATFDSITGRKSFNLGFAGIYVPEALAFLENFLQDDLTPGTTVFFELQSPKQIPPPEKLYVKHYYFLNPGTWFFVRDYFTELGQEHFIPNYRAAAWRRFFKVGLLKNMLKYSESDLIGNGPPKLLGPAGNGYFSLDDEMALGSPNKKKKLEKRSQQEGKEAYLAQISGDLLREKNDSDPEDYPHTYLNKMLDLIRLAEEQQVKLIFLYPPRMVRHTSLAAKIPPANCLSLNHPADFPELYAPENYFDQSHFNRRGAEVFTKLVAKGYLEGE
ncbi:MAG: hypothetical protein H6581_10705 [Bacteroidia bacterium]|nr:hypothetical protein [Bacteroidia bacterium]